MAAAIVLFWLASTVGHAYEWWAGRLWRSFANDWGSYEAVTKSEAGSMAGSVWRSRHTGSCGYVHEVDLAFDTETSGAEVNRATLFDWNAPLRIPLRLADQTYHRRFSVRGDTLAFADGDDGEVIVSREKNRLTLTPVRPGTP